MSNPEPTAQQSSQSGSEDESLARLAAVSYLFVPGMRADRFEKAIASGADRVIIDLEDAVDVADKDQARGLVSAAITEGLSAPILVRINPAETVWFDEDLRALAEAAAKNPSGFAGVVIPKLESGAAVAAVLEAFGAASAELEFVGLIESAAGVQALDTLAASGISRLGVGAVDLSVDLGTDISSPVLDFVYAQAVIASRLAGIGAPIGSPPLDLRADDATEAEARRLKSMGLAGQLCIHPAQVTPVHAGFAPTTDQVEWAHRVMASEGAAAQVDGQMIDKPVRERAERILALAARRSA